ncbi:DUF655 domain-containing protein [Candidatus Woesearchaeota archaeon]|nr:DUF655 domain-containing protein [Candidatus Woesearchaeota archaeon]
MLRKNVKEENAIVLDFLPNGHPFDPRPSYIKTPIAQAIGKEHFILLELVPKKGVFLQPLEEVYTGEGKRDKIHHIYGKVDYDKLTQTAKSELDHIVKDLVEKNEKRFIEFFNKAGPINMRRHQIELLPGIGKKHMGELLEKRKEKEFESFDDIKKRVKLLPDPEKVVIRRIISELKGEDKYNVFVGV